MTALFDILVVGGDEASLCAAACAAKTGVKTGLLPPPKKSKIPVGAISNIPNFVWRKLDLHQYGLSLEPVSARITLFDDDKSITTYSSVRRTKAALSAAGFENAELWEDFVEDVALLNDVGFISPAASGTADRNAKMLAGLLCDPKALDRASRLSGSCGALLSDYFNDSQVKDHIAAHALAPSGGGTMMNGSAGVLIDYLSGDAWRVRPDAGEKSVREILTDVCEQAGVQIFADASPVSFSSAGKHKEVSVRGGDPLKARHVFFATPDAATEAGAAPGSRRGKTTTATLHLTLSNTQDAMANHDRQAIYQIIDHYAELQAARDAASVGRLPEVAPVEFEYDQDGNLIARSAYCPAIFFEDGGWRDWTGQDRQAVAARMKERLLQRLPGLAEIIQKETIEVTGAETEPGSGDACDVIIQPHRHNAIGAAVSLIERVIASD